MQRLQSELSFSNKIERFLWGWVWLLLFRPSPRVAFRWRSVILRCFGAKVGKNVRVYNSVTFFHPRNIHLSSSCTIGPNVDLYCVAKISIGNHSIVSQNAEICAATHDHHDPNFKLLPMPISIGDECWICASAFVGPGVSIGDRAILGARGVLCKDLASGKIAAGNPAKVIGDRSDAEVIKAAATK